MVFLGNNVLFWSMFLLVCSFASLGDGAKQQHCMHEAMIKSFELDGNVFDCIDIYKQPSLRHPLLVNHTLQLKPDHPSKKNDHVMELSSHVWNLSKSCPEGSVPIQRTQRNSHSGGEHDGFLWRRQNVGPDALLHEVSPALFGDTKTRFFTLWTSDGYQNSCYNTRCSGFVQTNQHGILGALLQPVSVYDGSQHTIDVEIFKDKTTGNWWLHLQGVGVGYWPKELVPSLAGGARFVDFGGEVAYLRSGAHTVTQMGSGHFPSEGFRKSSFFRNVQVLEITYEYQSPGNGGKVIVESSSCYDLQLGENLNGPWGYYFFYGGPGRSEKCP